MDQVVLWSHRLACVEDFWEPHFAGHLHSIGGGAVDIGVVYVVCNYFSLPCTHDTYHFEASKGYIVRLLHT